MCYGLNSCSLRISCLFFSLQLCMTELVVLHRKDQFWENTTELFFPICFHSITYTNWQTKRFWRHWTGLVPKPNCFLSNQQEARTINENNFTEKWVIAFIAQWSIFLTKVYWCACQCMHYERMVERKRMCVCV